MTDNIENNNHGNQSLAERVFGVKDRSPGSLVLAHYALTGEVVNPDHFAAEAAHLDDYIGRIMNIDDSDDAYYAIDPELSERQVAMAILQQIFTEEKITGYHNILYGWPLYQELYEKFVHDEVIDETRNNALLIGSISSVSSKAFKALAEDVCRADRAYVIDLSAGEAKQRLNEFVFGNALRIPFQEETMRIAQTNLLTYMLRGYDGESVSNDYLKIKAVFCEAFRLLQKGGHLFMREKTPIRTNYRAYNRIILEEFKDDLSKMLSEAGFVNIAFIPVQDLVHPDFLFDSSRAFEQYETKLHSTSVGVYAQKPIN